MSGEFCLVTDGHRISLFLLAVYRDGREKDEELVGRPLFTSFSFQAF